MTWWGLCAGRPVQGLGGIPTLCQVLWPEVLLGAPLGVGNGSLGAGQDTAPFYRCMACGHAAFLLAWHYSRTMNGGCVPVSWGGEGGDIWVSKGRVGRGDHVRKGEVPTLPGACRRLG